MSDATGVGQLLRRWRLTSHLSQLELSARSGVSTRHISYVETGRAHPSRETILRLMNHLEIPLNERNRVLTSAGYAPSYVRRPLDSAELAPALEAVRRIVTAHEPYPAVAMDGHWNLLWANTAARILIQEADPSLLRAPANMMRIGLHPSGIGHRVRNLGQVRRVMLGRLKRQAERSGDPDLVDLHAELAAFADDEDAQLPAEYEIGLPLVIEYDGRELSLLNTVTTFGTALDLTLHDVVIETYLPMDAATALALQDLSLGASIVDPVEKLI